VASPSVAVVQGEAEPLVQIVATDELLEVHTAWLVTFNVAPDEVVPIAINWPVSFGEATDCALGMMESDTTSVVLDPPPVTVTVALLEIVPVNPFALAVIGIDPAPTPVTSPLELTVATLEEALVHVT
jgi:hypothetical protein